MDHYLRYIIPALLLYLHAYASSATTIVAYDFIFDSEPSSQAAGITSSTMLAGPATGGVPIDTTSSTGWVSRANPAAGRASTGSFFGRNASESPNATYIYFSVVPNPGFQMDLTSLSFDYAVQSDYSLSTFTQQLSIRSSLDGFASDIPAVFSNNPIVGGTGDTDANQAHAELSGFIGLTSEIEFRLYARKISSNYLPGSHFDNRREITRWDNISVQGVAGLISPESDLSGDGDVDDQDLGLFFASFTGPDQGPPTNPAADLSGDGDVDDEDLGLAFSAFTGPLAPASIPEPGSLAVLCLISTFLALCRRTAVKSNARQ